MTINLVKKTQREWVCNMCLDTIKEGTTMIRDTESRWVQTQFCLKCGKEKVEEALASAKVSCEIFNEKNNDPMSAYQMFKENKEYYENALRCIVNDNKR